MRSFLVLIMPVKKWKRIAKDVFRAVLLPLDKIGTFLAVKIRNQGLRKFFQP
jgi:hypothetical protein